MEFLDQLKTIWGSVDIIVVILVFAGGFWATGLLKDLTAINIWKWTFKIGTAYKTLFMSTLFSLLYVAILWHTEALPKDLYFKLFFSYIFATSFYTYLIKPFKIWLSKITNTEL